MTTRHTHPEPGTRLTFVHPSPEELRDLINRGRQLQAEAVRDGAAKTWRRLASAAGTGARALGRSWKAARQRLSDLRARRHEQLRVYRELMLYSDDELNELGINRRDVRDIARAA